MNRHGQFSAASFRKYVAQAFPEFIDYENFEFLVTIEGDYATLSLVPPRPSQAEEVADAVRSGLGFISQLSDVFAPPAHGGPIHGGFRTDPDFDHMPTYGDGKPTLRARKPKE